MLKVDRLNNQFEILSINPIHIYIFINIYLSFWFKFTYIVHQSFAIEIYLKYGNKVTLYIQVTSILFPAVVSDVHVKPFCFLLSSPSGWDKHSYGYHGDDGHSFCSSGTGQPYGPTFTTGDVIGCCVNLINNTCFYTKNGHSLGEAGRRCVPSPRCVGLR